jgi:VanZ family protein
MNLSRSNIIVFRISLAAAVTGILILATTPMEYTVVSGINDKLNHIFAFFVLSLLADFSFPENKFFVGIFLPLMGYGVAIELIQYFLPFRMFSLFDVAADALGILLYRLSLPLLQKSINGIFHKK